MRSRTWLRRAVTIPGLVGLWVADLALLPILVVAAVAVDLVERRSFRLLRLQLAVAVALGLHVAGVVLLATTWLEGLVRGSSTERTLTARVERGWAATTWRAARRLYRITVVVEGQDALAPEGPLVVMLRHASLLDVLLPIASFTPESARVPRYVAKRELLWDPCIDLMSHGIPTAFVRRGGREHDADLAAIEALATGLGPRDAVIIFPEGTRFTKEKRARALASLAARDDAAFARAARLRHVLPPHLAGPVALLERATTADVVFCAHTGLEGATRLRDLLFGTLIGRTVRIRFWRVEARDVPRASAERVAWLWQWWQRIDDWVDAHASAEGAGGRSGGAPR